MVLVVDGTANAYALFIAASKVTSATYSNATTSTLTSITAAMTVSDVTASGAAPNSFAGATASTAINIVDFASDATVAIAFSAQFNEPTVTAPLDVLLVLHLLLDFLLLILWCCC